MDGDKSLSAFFAKEAGLGVEQSEVLDDDETIIFKYNTTNGNEYQIEYADGTTDAYLNGVRHSDGNYYGTSPNYYEYYLDDAGTVYITPTEDLMYVEVIDWDSVAGGGDFSLTVSVTGTPTLIDDFESYTDGVAPDSSNPSTGTTWVTGVSSTDPTAEGPIVFHYFSDTNKVLRMCYGQLGDDMELTNTGYTYAQLDFTPPADGSIKFDYELFNYGGPTNYELLEVWVDFEGDIATATSPDYTLYSDQHATLVEGTTPLITGLVAANGVHTLTFKVTKTDDTNYEDRIEIDNLTFIQ